MNLNINLLKEVLRCEVIGIIYNNEKNYKPNFEKWRFDEIDTYKPSNIISIRLKDGIRKVNIYELANMYKEWAKFEGYYIFSSVGDAGWGHSEFTPTANIQSSRTGYLNIDSFTGESEAEVIFKACEWIYNEEIKGKNK